MVAAAPTADPSAFRFLAQITPTLVASVSALYRPMACPVALVKTTRLLDAFSAAATPVFEVCSLIADTAFDKPSAVAAFATEKEMACPSASPDGVLSERS